MFRFPETFRQGGPFFPEPALCPRMSAMMKRMNITRVHISRHAAQRLAQRGISLEDVHLVLRLGQRLHRTGVTFYFFGRRQIPPGLERELERLVGTTLIVSNGCLITAYRNKRAIAVIKKKPKRRARLSPVLEVLPETDLWRRCA